MQWASRIGWFIAIWGLSVAAITAVGWLIRLAIKG